MRSSTSRSSCTSARGPARPAGSRPILGVGGLLFQDGRVLLVKRAAPPAKGLWSIPGGKLRVGEALADGVAREVREETGLSVRVGALVEVFERLPTADCDAHFVVLDYLCEMTGGVLRAGDDADEAAWHSMDDLGRLHLTPGAVAVIRKGWRMQVGP